MLRKKIMLLITGPTGVGKTDLVSLISNVLACEVINADVGQFYTPLTIGTAKPDWQHEQTPHHLFDIIDEPRNITVADYRKLLLEVAEKIWQKNKLPIIVGGSLFYIRSLLFPPRVGRAQSVFEETVAPIHLWQKLHKIDPERALVIDKSDTYRIKRALDIWHTYGIKPSEYVPSFDPPAEFLLLYVTRTRQDLYARINVRTSQMIDAGWISEVSKLVGTEWEPFLQKKKLIGYPDIFDFLAEKSQLRDKKKLIERIAQKTRNYAKRQTTFWRMLSEQVNQELTKQSPDELPKVQELNLTLSDPDLYIKQLLLKLSSLFKGDVSGHGTQ